MPLSWFEQATARVLEKILHDLQARESEMRREATILWPMVSIMGILQGLFLRDDHRRRVHQMIETIP
jgi:hypothetical protein